MIDGAGGDDTLYSSGGNDTLIGGDGTFDFVSYYFSPAAVTIDLRLAGPQANGFGGTDTLQGLEGLGGSPFDDVLIGDAGFNVFVGGAGDDTIDGGDGYDVLLYTIDAGEGGIVADFRRSTVTGGAGGDTFANIEKIIGTSSADVFIGNALANQMQGMEGADTYTLGKGRDYVIYISTADSNAAAGIDRITDLAREDYLYLLPIDADTVADGDQAFRLVRAFSGAAGELTATFDRAARQTIVAGDVDGDGAADLTIHFDGNITSFVDGWIL